MSSEPLDVSLHVRMRYEAGGAARQALGDLDQVNAKARQLGAVGSDRLGRELRGVAGGAQSAERAIAGTAAQATKLGAGGTGRLEEGLKRLGAPAERARRDIQGIGEAVERVGRQDGVRHLGRDLQGATREAAALDRWLRQIDRHKGAAGGGSTRHGRHEFGNEALSAAGLGAGLRFGMGGAAAGGLAAGGGIALTGAAVARATREAISFEAAMADVRKAVDGLTPEGFAALERTILRTSAATGIAKEKMAQLVAEAGFAGRPVQELARFAEFGAKAAGAFGMTAEATGEALAKMGNVFKLNQAGIEDLADGINVLGDTTAAKEKQIVDFLYRTGSAGQALGLTALQTGAIGAAIISTGKEAEVAATGFNAFASKLGTADRQGKEFQAGLRALGLNARKVKADLAANPAETILNVLERLDKLPNDKKLDIASKLGGLEYGDDLLASAGAVDQIRAALGRLTDQSARAGSVEKTFKIFDETTRRNIDRTTASIEGFAARIGKMFTPAVNAAAAAVERWFNGMNKAMDRRADAEALAGRMAKGEELPPGDKARIEADPRLKDEVDRSLHFQKRRDELEANRRKAETDPGSLPSQDAFRRQQEEKFRQWEERRQRALDPAAPVPGTGKRSDLSDGARVSLAAYHQTVDHALDRTERRVDEAGRRMREDLAIGARVDLASLMRGDPGQQIRVERASLGGGSGGGGGGGRGYGTGPGLSGGGSGSGFGSAGGGGPRIAPGRFGGVIPPRAGRSEGGASPEGGAGGSGAHERFGDGGGTRGAARTGEMMRYAMDQLRREGVPEDKLREAAGHLVGQAHMESGLDPNKSHDGGTGYGIYGARDPTPGRGRRTNMLNWLKRNGYAPNSAEGQMRYMAHEAMSGRYRKTRDILMGRGSGDLEQDTNTITREFESPKVVNRRSGAVRNAIRVGPDGVPAAGRETAGTPQSGEGGRFDPLGGAARRYSSGYGMREHPVHGGQRMHHGQDMAAPGGSAVYAMQGGRVTRINRHGDVTVTHPDGSTKTYRHITPNGVRRGQQVEGGSQIGSLRHHDPRSTGPHLHLEATDPKGRRYDPRAEIEGAGRQHDLARPMEQKTPWTRVEPSTAGTRSGRFTDPGALQGRPRPPAEPAAGQRAGGLGGGGPSIVQNFHGGFDAQTVARRSQLERNRAVRRSMAGALHDIGRIG